MDATFKLSTNGQERSPLFRLPSELRLIILGHLLLVDGEIKSMEYYDQQYEEMKLKRPACIIAGESHDEVPPSFSMYEAARPHGSQLLSCCQALYYEGYEMLYLRNRLSIMVRHDHEEPTINISLLDSKVETHTGFWEGWEDWVERWSQPYDWCTLFGYKDDGSRDSARNFGCITLLRRSYQIAFRFRNLVIDTDICFHDADTHFYDSGPATCRALRDLTFGKNVVVKLPPPRGRDDKCLPAVMDCFTLWRCHAFELHTPEVPSADYHEICQVITGNSKVMDTFSILRPLREAYMWTDAEIFSVSERAAKAAFYQQERVLIDALNQFVAIAKTNLASGFIEALEHKLSQPTRELFDKYDVNTMGQDRDAEWLRSFLRSMKGIATDDEIHVCERWLTAKDSVLVPLLHPRYLDFATCKSR